MTEVQPAFRPTLLVAAGVLHHALLHGLALGLLLVLLDRFVLKRLALDFRVYNLLRYRVGRRFRRRFGAPGHRPERRGNERDGDAQFHDTILNHK